MKVYATNNRESEILEVNQEFNAILNALNSAGIDTTIHNYEMKAQRYERYTEGSTYIIKFTCPGDYLAYLAMNLHKPLTKHLIVEFFGHYWGIDQESISYLFDEAPKSLSKMADYANAYWWGDGDDFIIYLKNVSTGEYLCGPNEIEEEESFDEDW